ncbi:MAG: hypothetical protein ACRCX2_13630 [Paraclostridium sp.]
MSKRKSVFDEVVGKLFGRQTKEEPYIYLADNWYWKANVVPILRVHYDDKFIETLSNIYLYKENVFDYCDNILSLLEQN